jgi:ferric-dicitrate binding protein FerR (iron transport regulator)
MNRAIHTVLATAWVAASCMMAYAQPAQTVRLRGTIEKADGNALALKGTDGSTVRLALTNAVDGQIQGR